LYHALGTEETKMLIDETSLIVQFQKIFILTPQEFPAEGGGGWFYEKKKFNEMYEA